MMIRQSLQHSLTPITLPYLIGGTLLATSALAARTVRNALSKPYTHKQKKYKLEKVDLKFLAVRRLDPS